jgi:hypothetical protein
MFCLCPETLNEAKFKSNGLMEEISNLHRIQIVMWLLLTAFSQICIENHKQKLRRKTKKHSIWAEKEQEKKVVDKRVVIVRD